MSNNLLMQGNAQYLPIESNSIDSIVTDPPYGLSFMGKVWDHGVPGKEFWVEALRVTKPGGHMLAFGGTRTYHRLTCAIEDAGWEIRDCLMWIYGSGFPKSLDIGKAMDKEAGAVREVVEKRTYGGRNRFRVTAGASNGGVQGGYNFKDDRSITAPSTDLAKAWDGWGTALKPAWEPIILARKPISESTVAKNVAKWGTGGLNIGACRVGTEVLKEAPHGSRVNGVLSGTGKGRGKIKGGFNFGQKATPERVGRFPANLIHDGSDEVLAGFPDSKSTDAIRKNNRPLSPNKLYGVMTPNTSGGYSDQGSGARFFYCPKASKADRDEKLDGTCTVKYILPTTIKGGKICGEMVASLQKVTSDIPTVKWLIAESGESIMGLCQQDILSTILTGIRKITTSQILRLLPLSTIKESTQDVLSETVSGGSHVKCVEFSNQSMKKTGTYQKKDGLYTEDVDRAISLLLSWISAEENWKPLNNFHSTVKPTSLLQYLCRLITPPNGLVLDPFCGSGSTGKACKKEGFRFIGIEKEKEYCEITVRRIS